MSSATVYTSRFFRSESRQKFSLPGFQVYQTEIENSILVQDLFIAPGGSLPVDVSNYPHHLIIPVAGGALLSRRGADIQELLPGDVFYLPGNEEALLYHPFKETVNLLHIALKELPGAPGTSALEQLDVTEKNCLLQGRSWAQCLSIGVYDSRSTQEWTPVMASGSLFSIVLNGSFDFEGRLMEFRDALFQWDVSAIEFEALSEAAIILMIACSPTK